MSRKLVKAASKKDQKSILKYTKVEEDKCTTEDGVLTDIVAPISTEMCIELKDATPTQKRKRSQGNSPNSVEGSKPTKCINMSKTLEDKSTTTTQKPTPQYIDLDEDESTLSLELAKLERILSRKQTSSLEGIKNDIKLLLETEELIKNHRTQ